MFLDEDAAGLDDVLGFAVEQADRPDVRLQPVHTQRQYRLGRIGDRVQILVALLTLMSVACAERMTAISNSNGLAYSSSVVGAGMRSRSVL